MAADLDKWKRAVVHLEGAAGSLPVEEVMERMREISQSIANAEGNATLLLDEVMGRDRRFHGTALFVQDDDARYLVTRDMY